MDSLTALVLVPLLIWAGVWAFLLFLDRRVAALERALRRRDEAERSPAVRARAGSENARDTEVLSR